MVYNEKKCGNVEESNNNLVEIQQIQSLYKYTNHILC